VPDDEHGWIVRRILHNVFLLGNLDQEAGAPAVRDLFFDMVGRQYALQVRNGLAKCAKLVQSAPNLISIATHP
jgi:hypothetical protein